MNYLRTSPKTDVPEKYRTDAKLDRVGKQLADLGLVQGEVAEDLFYRNAAPRNVSCLLLDFSVCAGSLF